jgi:hypothetical protein
MDYFNMPGYYRAVIAAVNDPEERGRYRVRVPQIHDEEADVENLPWAELICFAGKGFGDVPNYDIGDLVCVIFEGGHFEFPAIIGAWISHSQGIPDFPPEQTEDYDTTRKRWMRMDRAGNLIEMSEVDDELRIRIKSGDAEIVVSQIDNSISIAAIGPVNISAQRAEITAGDFSVRSENAEIVATHRTGGGAGDAILNVFSSQTVNIYGGDAAGIDADAVVRLGQYIDGSAAARQTNLVEARSEIIQLGKKDDEGLPTPYKKTVTINVSADALVLLESNTKVQIDAPDVEVNASNSAKVVCSAIELGAGTMKQLANYALKAAYDAHTHGGVQSGGSLTGAPTTPLSANEFTADTKAS